jgi:alkylhydroperoxidase family enzyme
LTEARLLEIEAARDELPQRTQVALDFAERLSNDYLRLDLGTYRALEQYFSRAELTEIVAFSAWQFGGPRMLASWKAEDYKRGERPVLDDLPVRLAYLDSRDDFAPPAQPPLPGKDPETILAMAERSGSPPVAWLRFLAAQPSLLEAWSSFYWTLFDSGVLPARLKHLVRVRMAQVIDCPEWVAEDAPRLLELSIGSQERLALERADADVFSAKELAVLAYAEEMSYGVGIDDAVFDRLASHCSEAELVELGFLVASQNGVIRTFRWLSRVVSRYRAQ